MFMLYQRNVLRWIGALDNQDKPTFIAQIEKDDDSKIDKGNNSDRKEKMGDDNDNGELDFKFRVFHDFELMKKMKNWILDFVNLLQKLFESSL